MPRRNLEAIRDLLLKAEAAPINENDDFNTGIVDLMDQISAEEGYHLKLMLDAGLIDGRDVSIGLFRLTSSGHDYLYAVRDSGIWSKTKQAVAETGGSATLDIIKSLGIEFLKTKIEKHTGIAL